VGPSEPPVTLSPDQFQVPVCIYREIPLKKDPATFLTAASTTVDCNTLGAACDRHSVGAGEGHAL
jgi:hypothetical protein